VVAYVPITLTNLQGSRTPVGFQQLLNVNFNSFNSYLNQYAENIEFYDSAWNPIYAWIQSGAFCPNCTSSQIWVKLDQSIPANGAITIYFAFLSTSVNEYGSASYVGVSPEQTASYAYFDNGKFVFNSYDNFKGNSLNSTMWDTMTYNGAKISVHDSLTISGTGGNGNWAYGQVYAANAASNQVEDVKISSSNVTDKVAEWDIGFETNNPT
jgi:hypothetical protein